MGNLQHRDVNGNPAVLEQTATFQAATVDESDNLKKRIEVVNPPIEWLELTSVGQGYGRLGVDGKEAPYRYRSDYIPATLDRSHWFVPLEPFSSCSVLFPDLLGGESDE